MEPIGAHYGLTSQIKKAEEEKKQAAMEEEFEEAARLKKIIL